MPDALVLDPERPIDKEELIDRIIAGEEKPHGHPIAKGAVLITGFLILAVLWRFGPFARWFNLGTIQEIIASIRMGVATPFLVVGAFVAGGMLMVPLTLLIIATAVVFDPFPHFCMPCPAVLRVLQ